MAASLCMSSGGVAFANVTNNSVKASDIERDGISEHSETHDYDAGISDGGLEVSSRDGTPGSNDDNIKASATVTGDVTNNSDESAVKATAYSEASGDTKASTKVTVTGNAKAESISNTVQADQGGGAGVKAEANAMGTKSGAETDVTVKGNVKASGTGSPTGVYASSSSNTDSGSKNTASTTVIVEGNISAITTGDGYNAVTATGVEAKSEQGEGDTADTKVTVMGDVSATSSSTATGIDTTARGDDASTIVDVKGKVSSNSSGTNASGIKVDSNTYGGDVNVHVGKDVDVTYSGNNSWSSDAGINFLSIGANNYVDSGDGKIDIVVDGSVNVNSTGFAYGINGGEGNADVDIKVGRDVIAKGANGSEAIQIMRSDNSFTVDVGGSVKQTGTVEGAVAINIADAGNSSGEGQGTPTIKVTVAGDVTSDNNTIQVSKTNNESTIEVEVDGTVSGKEHNIVLMGESTTENLDITVWKVDTSNDKHVVDTYDYENGYSKVDVGDSIVNYIIIADSTEAKIAMSGQGEQRSDGTYVAKQGKEVYFSVDIPDGYTAEFYDVNDNTAYQIIPNGTGGAYISVPRGGGVYVGVRLTKTSTAESNSDSTKESSSANTVTIVNSESRSESGASDGEYWSPSTSSNNQANALGGVFSGYETLQALTIPSAIYGGPDMFVNVAEVLTPVDTITAMNNFTGTDRASINTNNVMGAGIVDFKNMFVNASSNTVEVPVPANVIANQSYTVMFSDGTSMVVPCAMNGVLSIPFSKTAEGLTYIICGIQLDPSMFIGMPPATGWTY